MTEAESGTGELSAGLGEMLVVRVPEVMSGHVWTVAELGDGLVVVGERYEGGGAPGQGADHVFEVRADKVGVWEMRLRLARAWESAAIDERRVTVRVG